MAKPERRRVQQPTTPQRESRVQQHHKDNTDLNLLMAKHTKPGGPGQMGMPLNSGPINPHRIPQYMELPSESYHDMLNKVTDVQNWFRTFHPRLRGRFRNDPYQLLRFIDDPNNRPEAIRLGLVLPTAEEAQALREAGKPVPKQQPPTPPPEAARPPEQAPRPDPEAQPRYPGGGGQSA